MKQLVCLIMGVWSMALANSGLASGESEYPQHSYCDTCLDESGEFIDSALSEGDDFNPKNLSASSTDYN
ncbi:hypothetical protein AVI51_05365 [Piscirickettsia salmonis]|uniref:Uncharacterized protein n=1 Tax=Piscirickettsia salmonis TaxID=1238 RepID=A0A9Q5VCU1_PISSA|nr:hypothetical protein [Piscirickettsia salmonis]ALA25512.1 glycoside hydrolase family 37 [Piscirickettsia salmonis]APS43026.1 hypothetical protein AVI48_00585 [Piscirickettsia salmonis]APS46375.1 hypothetical protein AVI49_01180 [Piscirickettsia salmonis]APS50343.1 hypothetical protein AVI50_05430 [Piscirickettsia salmonis]APS53542.1 hypothetical protein AVI51_05365 [Piscirickettsia salmonis]